MPDNFEEEEIPIPGFATGGRVQETGIALVHEGEYIIPEAGSEALIEPAAVGGQAVVNYPRNSS